MVRIYVAFAIGVLMAGLTTLVERLETEPAVMMLLIPGLLGSAAVSGNIHGFSIVSASIINGVFYFGVAWVACLLWARVERRRQRGA